VSFKAAISVGPVPSILHFTDQVWAAAVLGHFVRALRWVQGTCVILGALGSDEGGRWEVSLLY
jgi:hypothetical protein